MFSLEGLHQQWTIVSIILHNSPWKYLNIVKSPGKKQECWLWKFSIQKYEKHSFGSPQNPEILIILLLGMEEPFKDWITTTVNSACRKSKRTDYLDGKCLSKVLRSEIRISSETLKLYIKLKQTRVVPSTRPSK